MSSICIEGFNKSNNHKFIFFQSQLVSSDKSVYSFIKLLKENESYFVSQIRLLFRNNDDTSFSHFYTRTNEIEYQGIDTVQLVVQLNE
jgi:hypothetical protein